MTENANIGLDKMLIDGKKRLIIYSVMIFFFAAISSNSGMNNFRIDLVSFNDNIFIANLTYLGFLMVINERVVEVVKTNFMEPEKLKFLATKKELESQLCLILKKHLNDTEIESLIRKLSPEDYDEIHELEYLVLRHVGTDLDEYKRIKSELKKTNLDIALHANATRTYILRISLIVAGALSCLGCASFLYPLIDSTLFITDSYEKHIIEGVSAVITSWAIAAGSDGWNTVTDWVGKSINNKKGTVS